MWPCDISFVPHIYLPSTFRAPTSAFAIVSSQELYVYAVCGFSLLLNEIVMLSCLSRFLICRMLINFKFMHTIPVANRKHCYTLIETILFVLLIAITDK